MGSRLVDIFEALAEMPVAVNGAVVNVYGLDTLPNSVAAAALPARLLLPLGTRSEGRSVSFATFGQNGVVVPQWRITDVLLYKPTAQGRGLNDVAPDLIAYMAAYVDALRATRTLAGATIVDAGLEPGVWTYPVGGSKDYYGVEATLTLKEIVA